MIRSITQFKNVSKIKNVSIADFLVLNAATTFRLNPIRFRGHLSRETRPVLYELNDRRKTIELNNKLKEINPIDRRSSFSDWNYEAELTALNSRLGENIPLQVLSEVFTTESHIQEEKEKQEKLNIDIQLNLKSNEELSAEGIGLLDRCLTSWLRGALPALPEQGIQAVKEYLTSEDVLTDIAFHIGCKDLIQAVEYPPLKADYAKAFQALVGALARIDVSRAETLILDLVAVQLIGKDLNEIWDVGNPMRVLSMILNNEGMGPPEPRLLWQCGPKTILSSFTVGIYSDKQLIGEYAGESLEIAEEMAARDALRNLFKTNVSHFILPTHEKFSNSVENPSVQDWKSDKLPNLVIN